MDKATGDQRVLCGLMEAAIGVTALAGIMAVAMFVAWTIMPDLSRQIIHLSSWSQMVGGR